MYMEEVDCVCMGRGCVNMEGVECVCMGEREDVCIRKGWSVHAWSEGGCVIRKGWSVNGEREDEGVRCVCIRSGRMCV